VSALRGVLFAQVPSFYAEVERAADRDGGERPILVGGDPRKRGRVQSASRDAVAAGVVEGMSMLEALERCPRARVLRTDMKRYREASARLRAVLRETAEGIEPMALDAAFVDLDQLLAPDPEALAARLRERVREELALPLRVGIAPVKFMARLAAEEAGYEGCRIVAADEAAAFLADLPVARLPGVGPRTLEVLQELGLTRVRELQAVDPQRLEQRLGNHGLRILELARGREDAPVRAARHPRSVGRECTFDEPQLDMGVLWDRLDELARELGDSLSDQGLGGRRVALKVRYADRETATRSRTLPEPVAARTDLYREAARLLDRTHAGTRPVRGLGINVSALESGAFGRRQLDLFQDAP